MTTTDLIRLKSLVDNINYREKELESLERAVESHGCLKINVFDLFSVTFCTKSDVKELVDTIKRIYTRKIDAAKDELKKAGVEV